MVVQARKAALENTVCPGERMKTVEMGVGFWKRASVSSVWCVFSPRCHSSLDDDVIYLQ